MNVFLFRCNIIAIIYKLMRLETYNSDQTKQGSVVKVKDILLHTNEICIDKVSELLTHLSKTDTCIYQKQHINFDMILINII